MAKVVYGVVQKPLVDRLVDGACIFWDVEVGFFSGKGRDEVSALRRHILFYLLITDGGLNDKAVGERYGFGRVTVREAVELVDFRRTISRQIADELAGIRSIAANLEARIVVMDVKLEHFMPGNIAGRDNGGK